MAKKWNAYVVAHRFKQQCISTVAKTQAHAYAQRCAIVLQSSDVPTMDELMSAYWNSFRDHCEAVYQRRRHERFAFVEKDKTIRNLLINDCAVFAAQVKHTRKQLDFVSAQLHALEDLS